MILQGEPGAERVDLGLLLGCEGGKIQAIALRERPLIGRLPIPVAGLLRLQLGHQRGHFVPDLALDLLEWRWVCRRASSTQEMKERATEVSVGHSKGDPENILRRTSQSGQPFAIKVAGPDHARRQ